jgi:hypothetical protein
LGLQARAQRQLVRSRAGLAELPIETILVYVTEEVEGEEVLPGGLAVLKQKLHF